MQTIPTLENTNLNDADARKGLDTRRCQHSSSEPGSRWLRPPRQSDAARQRSTGCDADRLRECRDYLRFRSEARSGLSLRRPSPNGSAKMNEAAQRSLGRESDGR